MFWIRRDASRRVTLYGVRTSRRVTPTSRRHDSMTHAGLTSRMTTPTSLASWRHVEWRRRHDVTRWRTRDWRQARLLRRQWRYNVTGVTQSDAEFADSVDVVGAILSDPHDVRHWPTPSCADELQRISLGQSHRRSFRRVHERLRCTPAHADVTAYGAKPININNNNATRLACLGRNFKDRLQNTS